MLHINEILLKSYKQNASDVHITVGVPPIFRINGNLTREGTSPIDSTHSEQFAKELTNDDEWNKFITIGELDLSYHLEGICRFRINLYMERGNISLAIRLIPTKIPSLEDLQLPPIITKMIKKSQGLLLITGPTGSGKSTTLAAIVNHLNKLYAKHIITLEDPIEYMHTHEQSIIDQREIGRDTKSFASGLRSSLRQDPDIILVGELRDLETIQTAITAAETGHLVLATLHSSTTSSTIDRIIDVFPAHQQSQIRFQLATVLVGIMSQRLVPFTDRFGRTVVTEILVNTPAVSNLIRTEKVHQIENILQTSKALGMHTFEMNINELVKLGKISKEHTQSFLAGV